MKFMNRVVTYSNHVKQRMMERSITLADVIITMNKGGYERNKGLFRSSFNNITVVYSMTATIVTIVTTF